jgi:putative effector of murein hydrolase
MFDWHVYRFNILANLSFLLTTQIAKVLAVIILGFVFSLSTVAFSVLALRSAQGTLIAPAVPKGLPKSSSIAAAAAPPKPFRDETMNQLLQGVVISGILSAAVNKSGRFTEYQTLLRTIFFGITTVAAYVWGARLPSSFTSLIHPLVTSTALTWTAVCGYAIFTKSTFLDVLRTYKVGTLAPLKTGAGDILLHLLGPAVVSFAVSMYSRKKLLKDNLLVLLTAMLISSIGGLFGTAAFVRAIDLGGQTGVLVRLSVLSRNVTTALAMVVTSILGGDVSLVAAVVVLTGIIGATFGRSLLDTMRIQDPVARGVGIGASSQGLGVASLAGEPDAFPFAAMSMVLNAIAATVLVSIPAVKTALVELASGTATK